MRLLVTGGAGFIGSQYVRGLLDGRYQAAGTGAALPGGDLITVLDKLTYAGSLDNLPVDDERVTFVEGDICDARLLAEVLPGHDAVVHFAAESHVDRSIGDASPFVMTNVVGTQTLLEACRAAKVERIVHVSTDEVYGSIDEGSWTEDFPLAPNSPYSASKAASDLFARAYWRTHGLSVSVTRCCNNYGPYQYVEKVIPLFITSLTDGGDVPLYGDGHHIREWLHVDDHCRAIHLVLTRGGAGETYNIGGGSEITNLELTDRLLKLCGADWDRVRRVPDRKAHDERYSLDSGKIREELGFEPEIPFGSGLASVVDWYRDNRWWWEKAKAGTA
ncbi:dTDP-glucose 4,6-dehydratase [Streptomyces armeniacus]|uniref:dTDP-glucose 4,6-dehydratase n=1 Tax=Streptomyces armeniacus TaxID=83291 RepID=A0A345XZ48_9ACTN|nr:dTDP-glucose 4,6-dehydratase [Streptomyces armeniacus]AXK36914.1 dTDP-glucose 4,6-dehydratase [Streptomyces armeniacus]